MKSLYELYGSVINAEDAELTNWNTGIIITHVKNKSNVYSKLSNYYQFLSAENKSGFSEFLAKFYGGLK